MAIAKTTWKNFEQRVAKFFGSRRAPLSGGNGGVTRSDSLHDELFIECKLRVKHAAVTLLNDAKDKAKKEGKIPVVVLGEKNRPGFWIVCHSDDLENVATCRSVARLEKQIAGFDDK